MELNEDVVPNLGLGAFEPHLFAGRTNARAAITGAKGFVSNMAVDLVVLQTLIVVLAFLIFLPMLSQHVTHRPLDLTTLLS
jgi:hypothetical protein